MTGANPIFGAASAAAGSAAASSSAQTAANNVLGPNAFITLLTAQLQAQDPSNPLDPNQMVDELTSMNTLQQTIQIRQDLDSLVAATQGSQGGAGTGSTAGSTAAPDASNAAAKALAAGSSASSVLAPTFSPASAAYSAAKLYSQLGSKSHIF